MNDILTNPLKLGGLIFVACFCVIFGLYLSEGPKFADAENLQEAKEAADYFINDWQSQYDELCDGPRNDAQKEKFAELASYVQTIWDAPYKFSDKLDYSIQKKAADYISKKMEKHPDLKALGYSTINCW